MNEGSIPTLYSEASVVRSLDIIKKKNSTLNIPTIAFAGGFANETQTLKALAMANAAIICNVAPMARAPLTAAMKIKFTAKAIGKSETNFSISCNLEACDNNYILSKTVSLEFVKLEVRDLKELLNLRKEKISNEILKI